MDPARRTDPGALFPWAQFLGMITERLRPEPIGGEDEMAKIWTLVDLGPVMDTVDWLYVAAGIADPVGKRAWAEDLANKLQAGEDPRPTVEYIRWALAQQKAIR